MSRFSGTKPTQKSTTEEYIFQDGCLSGGGGGGSDIFIHTYAWVNFFFFFFFWGGGGVKILNIFLGYEDFLQDRYLFG